MVEGLWCRQNQPCLLPTLSLPTSKTGLSLWEVTFSTANSPHSGPSRAPPGGVKLYTPTQHETKSSVNTPGVCRWRQHCPTEGDCPLRGHQGQHGSLSPKEVTAKQSPWREGVSRHPKTHSSSVPDLLLRTATSTVTRDTTNALTCFPRRLKEAPTSTHPPTAMTVQAQQLCPLPPAHREGGLLQRPSLR